MNGAWIVFEYDMNPYPLALFADELEARRWADGNGYGRVKFWEWGAWK